MLLLPIGSQSPVNSSNMWVQRVAGSSVLPKVDADFVNGRVWLDGALASMFSCTRASVGSYVNLDGTLSSFSVDALRRSTNGLLVEPAATSVARHSEDENSSWQLVNVSRGAMGVDPYGTTTAQLYIPSVPDTGHTVQLPTATVANATVYTWSIFAKYSGNASIANLTCDGFTGVIVFNTRTGAASWDGAPGGGSVASVALGSGWYRFSITWTTTSTSKAPTFYLVGYGDGAGDGVNGIYMWGSQVELGAVATTYIATVGASVTRAADAVAFTIPAAVGHLVYTLDDDSTQTVAVSPGAYTIPTNLNRPYIKRIISAA